MSYVLTGLLIAGCDYLSTPDNRAVRDDAAERQRRADDKSVADALDRYIANRITLLLRAETEDAEVLVSVSADRKTFSKIVADTAKKEERDKSHARAAQLLRLLKNDAINDLARKYLNSDFALLASRYVADIRNAKEQESLYQRKLQECETRFHESIEDAKKWATATREQRDKEIDRLQAEIGDLEQRRERYQKDYRSEPRHAMQGEQGDARSVVNMKINDAEQEIDKKRRQIDFLRSPSVQHGMSRRPLEDTQRFEERASHELYRWQQEIDRRLKPKMSVNDVVTSYEKESVVALQDNIAKRIEEIEKRDADIGRKVLRLKELRISVPVSNRQELQKIRDEAVKL